MENTKEIFKIRDQYLKEMQVDQVKTKREFEKQQDSSF